MNPTLQRWVLHTESEQRFEDSAALPESLLDDDGRVATLLETLVLLVGSVLVLDDGGRLTASLETLLSIVAPELTLDQNCCLGHLFVISVLQ